MKPSTLLVLPEVPHAKLVPAMVRKARAPPARESPKRLVREEGENVRIVRGVRNKKGCNECLST